MASEICSTTRYVTTGADLTGGTYTKGENLYINRASLKITNKSSDAFTNADFGTNGIIGTVREVPDLNSPGDRLVVDFSCTAAQQTGLRLLLDAEEL